MSEKSVQRSRFLRREAGRLAGFLPTCSATAWRLWRRRRLISTDRDARNPKSSDRSGALAYATESMRLTTRLMQLASWLLLHRAVKEGEMSLAQANKEKAKVKLSAGDMTTSRTSSSFPSVCAR